MAQRCRALARECHRGLIPPVGEKRKRYWLS